MNKQLGSALLAGVVLLTACKESATDTSADANAAADSQAMTLDSEVKKVSYAMGLSLGDRFRIDKMSVDNESFNAGFSTGLEDGERLMTQEEIQLTMQTFQQQQQAKMAAEQQAVAERNKVEGDAFLAENSKREGVITTESGLQYKVLTAGEGKKPGAEDTVSVHYRGTLIDGQEFDSSYSRGTPAEFPVNRVIPGWTEALQLMPAGSKWELYIPSDLAYGPGGTGPLIGPNATLMFEVELLEIK